jgi:indole-3-glycerol phosphate synthase/phosphoribosylanthranilate isomerase
MPFLSDITRRRRIRMKHFCEELPQTEILTRHEKARHVIPVLSKLRAREDLAVIAGFVKADPNGPIAPKADHITFAHNVTEAGADMILVATEPATFDGAFEDIHEVTQYSGTNLPVLALDFAAIGDVFPIFRACGADVALIVYAGLKGDEAKELIDFCPRAGLTPCMIVYTQEELEATIALGYPFVCVAAYDPDTYEIDAEKALAMTKYAKDHACLTIYVGGVETREQAEAAAAAGADAVVITKPLMLAENEQTMAEIIEQFKGIATRPLPQKTLVKVDGIMSQEAADVCVAAGVDYISMHFSDSPYKMEYEPARLISESLPRGTQAVGVFANEGRALIETAVKLAQLSIADLRGLESPDLCETISVPVWKKIRVTGAFDPLMVAPYVESCAGYMITGASPADYLNEEKTPVNYDALGILPISKTFGVTGGLNAQNVYEAIEKSHPNIVELVLEPGQTDFACIQEFVDAVRAADKEVYQL